MGLHGHRFERDALGRVPGQGSGESGRRARNGAGTKRLAPTPEPDEDEVGMTRGDWAIVSLLFVGWGPGLLALSDVWSSVEYASHGYLVPFVALWAATAHRDTLATLPAKPMPGGLLALGAMAIAYVGLLGFGDESLLGLLFVATVVVAVLALRGVEWVRTLKFPLAYLLFMVPLPNAWVTPLIVELQILVSTVAVRLLQASGVAIFREGNVLTLPGDQTLFVAEACSGITSLVTLIPIGVFIAYFTESVTWRRVAVVFAVVPIALAGNLVRVILTVLLAIEVDVTFATEGPLHEWAGVATYVLGCLCLLAVGEGLRRLMPESPRGTVTS